MKYYIKSVKCGEDFLSVIAWSSDGFKSDPTLLGTLEFTVPSTKVNIDKYRINTYVELDFEG